MPIPDLSAPDLAIVAWADPVIDVMGYDPRSTYVERYWLAILGPSTTWLVRHLAHRFESAPEGFTLQVEDTAATLGLGHTQGRHSPLVRALYRCCQFGVARATPDGTLAARRHLPPLTRRQVDRLPAPVRTDHAAWRATERDAATLDAQGRRARRLSLALAELGEDVATAEQRLQRWRIHPVVAREAVVWAQRLVAARDDPSALRPRPAIAHPVPGGDGDGTGSSSGEDDPLEALLPPARLGGDAA